MVFVSVDLAGGEAHCRSFGVHREIGRGPSQQLDHRWFVDSLGVCFFFLGGGGEFYGVSL